VKPLTLLVPWWVVAYREFLEKEAYMRTERAKLEEKMAELHRQIKQLNVCRHVLSV